MDLDNSVLNNERGYFSQSRCSNCGGSQPTEKLYKQQWMGKGYKKPTLNPLNSNN